MTDADLTLTNLPGGWHNHDGYRAVFLAALQGICANPHFFGAIHQGSPSAAVTFAQEVVSETIARIAGQEGSEPTDGALGRQDRSVHAEPLPQTPSGRDQ